MGKYLKVWLQDDNAQRLENVTNKSGTINEALRSYLGSSGYVITTDSDSSSTFRGSTDGSGYWTTTTGVPSVTCPKGHLLNGTTGLCSKRSCKHSKPRV